MKKRLVSCALGDPRSLVALVASRLELDAAEVGALITRGSIYVGQDRVAADRELSVGDKVTIFVEGRVAAGEVTFAYRDRAIAVAEKPAGLPAQAERSQRQHALDAEVRRLLAREVFLMHRLDKEASGLCLFALERRVCATLSAALAEGTMARRYLAIVDGAMQGEGTIRLRIARHPTDRRLRAALPENAPAGESATSHYRVLAGAALDGHPVTAVALTLETGRTHQLRVHLSASGHPILGDAAYGGSRYERLCLHAQVLELRHPDDGRLLRVTGRLPEALERLIPNLDRLAADI